MPVLIIFTGVSRRALLFGLVAYLARMFFITAGYHRYFAHRSFRLARIPQFLLAFGGLTAVQKGPLWWAANHRAHHRYTDTERDPHSPQQGFLWAHMGWILTERFDHPDLEVVADFAKFPELRWLDRHYWIGGWSLGVLSFLVAGWSGLIVGFFASTVVLWHVTFCVNSVAHLWGSRRYATGDSSRNNPVVALLTMGEGWHNNHHHYPRCARQGFRWWELDITYLILRGLALVGIVKDLREPPAQVVRAGRIKAGVPDLGLARLHLARAASVVATSASGQRLIELFEHAADEANELARGRVGPLAGAGPEGG